MIKLLDDNGATRDLYLSDIVSHVIADSTEPDEYSEAKDLFERPIVSVSQFFKTLLAVSTVFYLSLWKLCLFHFIYIFCCIGNLLHQRIFKQLFMPYSLKLVMG